MDTTGTECMIGLGGNIGDVAHTFRVALQQLTDAGCQVIEVSSLYRTAAMGPDAGEPFLNAVARITTKLSAHALLALMLETEARCGRIREQHWGPRRLDLDLLDYGGRALFTEVLILPHPGIWYRRFVLEPMAEIAAGWGHPMLNFSVTDLLQRSFRRPLLIDVDTEADLPRCPAEFRESVRLRRFQAGGAVGTLPTSTESFCRVICQPVADQVAMPVGPFVLNTTETELQPLIESVLTASLGLCEKGQQL